LTSFDNSISYIDLNVNFDDKTLALLIDYSRKKQTKIILSYHNYLETPPKNDLIKIIDCCEKYKPDVIKVACKANSMEDCANLLSLYYDTATRVPEISKKLICISMGNLGKISRIASIYLGAPFTYTAWKKGMETADGQFDIESIQKIMELINDVL